MDDFVRFCGLLTQICIIFPIPDTNCIVNFKDKSYILKGEKANWVLLMHSLLFKLHVFATLNFY
jgi:hypothetical protein